MTKYEEYIARARELGVTNAKIIPANTIVTAEWVRVKCQYGCGGYGSSLVCPPSAPTPEQTRKILADYNDVLLVHVDEMNNLNKIVSTLEREIFLDGYHKAFAMGAGPCDLCEKCPKFCKYPERARPSMEACGIDVFSTVRANGFPIEVLNTQTCNGNYYGVVLIE